MSLQAGHEDRGFRMTARPDDRAGDVGYRHDVAAGGDTVPEGTLVLVDGTSGIITLNPDPAEAHNDIDLESALLYNAARRVPGVTAELRIMNGGHDWDVWQPGFREGIVDIASRLRTAPATQWEAELFGAEGDDRAGGARDLVADRDEGVQEAGGGDPLARLAR